MGDYVRGPCVCCGTDTTFTVFMCGACDDMPRTGSQEERHAWDMYAAAAMSDTGYSVDTSALMADNMLKARRNRFGGGK